MSSAPPTRPLKVCYFGTYRENYSRNQIMMAGLRENGVEVIECHETLWQGVEDRVQAASGGWLNPKFLLRVIATYARLIRRYRRTAAHDLIVIGYPGQVDVFLGWILSRLTRRPLVWDVFMSIYLIMLERRLNEASRLSAGLVRRIEWLGLRLPDRLIIDTRQYARWLQSTHGIAEQRFFLVPTGADDRIFQRAPQNGPRRAEFEVLYYGSFIANHNVPLMVEAARLVAGNQAMRFKFIGDGPERQRAEEMARAGGLANCTFNHWMEKGELVAEIARADVCLGVFGSTPQSLMTVQNKIYEGLAMGKPVLSGDSETVRDAFEDRKHLYLCPRNAQALAAALEDLFANPDLCAQMAANGYELYRAHFTVVEIGKAFRKALTGYPLR